MRGGLIEAEMALRDAAEGWSHGTVQHFVALGTDVRVAHLPPGATRAAWGAIEKAASARHAAHLTHTLAWEELEKRGLSF